MRQHFRQTHHITASDRSRAPRWFMASAALLMFAATLGAVASPARAQFDRITVFGDSYADTGTAPGGAFRIIYGWGGCPAASQTMQDAGYNNCHFTGGTNFADTLQTLYGVPTLTNYAIGGARSDNTNTMPGSTDNMGFVRELNAFAASGTRFTERDLVLLSIGGNDESLMTPGDTTDQVNARATITANNALAGIQQLVAAGARNIIWFGAGNSNYFPVPTPPEGGGSLSNEQRATWAHTYFRLNQELLAPLALSGVRIFLFDYETLQARIAANPSQYGFASGGGCQATLGIPGCLAASWEEQNSFFYWNGVHPTSDGMALVARYMANQVDAPTTVVPQGRITFGLATNFTTSVLGHLDTDRTFQAYGLGDGMALVHARDMKDTREAKSRWLSFGGVTYGTAGTDRQFYAAGYDYHAVSGTIGVEYKATGNTRFGAQFGYSTPTIDLDVQNAQDRITTYQFAGYGSFAASNWFADALIAYGRQNYVLDRDGIIDTIRGSTNADTLSAAGRAGYLVTIGPLRAGPIGGVNYTGGTIHAYTETGDSLITMMVDRQTLDNLTSDAGLQVRLPLQFGSGHYSPFVNVTVEHDFTGSGRTITTTQVTTPLLPVLTPVEDNGGTYGKVAAGVAAMLDTGVTATMNAETTFGRDGGDDVVVNGGLRLTF
jgi:outer membrane lipase/esterase